jgi:hypothetical protein
LNNDTIVPPGWLGRILRHKDDRAVGLVGPVTNRIGNEAQIEVSYRSYGEFLDFAREYHAAHGRPERLDIRLAAMFCVAMRRDVFLQVGPLDEGFGLGLFEDDDYAMRVRQSGYRVVCAEDVFVHHFGEASIGKLAATGEYGPLFHANRRRWEEKWGRAWEPYARRPSPGYQDLVGRIRQVVRANLPSDARVLVVSKGDDALLELAGRQAWHFPRGPDGGYAGHNPPSGREAIAHLEELRAAGADYLLLPATARWWLDYYGGLREHLERRYRTVANQSQTCVVFALREKTSPVDHDPREEGRAAHEH